MSSSNVRLEAHFKPAPRRRLPYDVCLMLPGDESEPYYTCMKNSAFDALKASENTDYKFSLMTFDTPPGNDIFCTPDDVTQIFPESIMFCSTQKGIQNLSSKYRTSSPPDMSADVSAGAGMSAGADSRGSSYERVP